MSSSEHGDSSLPENCVYSDQELLAEIQRLAEEHGKTPTAREMGERGKYASSTYLRRFGSWTEALEKAGLTKNDGATPVISEQELLDELHRLAEEHGKTLTACEMREHGKYGLATYFRRFGSWNEALEKVGLEHKKLRSVDTCDQYGPNWKDIRSYIRRRDNHCCRVCLKSESQMDQAVPVHHITPRRVFLEKNDPNYDRMNRPSNLISLCASCHTTFEGCFQACDATTFAFKARADAGVVELPGAFLLDFP